MPTLAKHIRALILLIAIIGCQSHPSITTVQTVDIERFMGDWYVIASIPTAFEKNAFNALESYRLNEDGTVATTFTFNQGGFDGPRKTYTAKGFVSPEDGNAVWGMQFIWPFRAEYRIIYLTTDYTQTVIGRSKRDYVWVMARTPEIPAADNDRIRDFLVSEGYDIHRLQKVPQQPVEQR